MPTARSDHVRPSPAATAAPSMLPCNIFRFVLAVSGLHQLALLAVSVAVFLIEIIPLELQRRIVNDIVKQRPYRAIVTLCLVYVGVALCHGATKLFLNIYRSWVGERATRDLRRRVDASLDGNSRGRTLEADGIGISMIVAEVEPIGSFVGASISEPILQAGVLLSVIAYMIHLEASMAAVALLLFLPQLIFVPLMQGAINRRSAARVWMLRRLSIGLVVHAGRTLSREDSGHPLIDRVFELNMAIFRLKFSMNFLMNFCNHLQIITAFLLGSWFVLTNHLAIGGVVAFISGINRLNDPWGDLVNYFRDATSTQIKLRLLADAIAKLVEGAALDRSGSAVAEVGLPSPWSEDVGRKGPGAPAGGTMGHPAASK